MITFIVLIVGLVLVALMPVLGWYVVPIGIVLGFSPWIVQYPFWLLLWLIVTYPLIYPARIRLPGGLPDIAYERGIVAILVGIVLWQVVMSKESFPRVSRLAGAFFILYTLAVLAPILFGGLVAPNFSEFIEFVVLPFTLYWLTRYLVVTKQQIKWLLQSIALVAVLICFTGLYERVLDLEESPFQVSAHTEGGDTRYGGVPGGRAAGVLGNPAVYGAVMGMGALACFALVSNCRSFWQRLQVVLPAVLLMYGVYASFTRSAWLAVLSTLFLVQFFIKDLWKFTLPAFCVGTVVLIMSWGVLAEDETVKDRVLDQQNLTGRVERLTWCWNQLLEKPITGWGMGATNHLMSQEFQEAGFSTSHNTFMSLLLDGGPFLGVSFVALLSSWVLQGLVFAQKQQNVGFTALAAAALAGFVLIYAVSGMALELRYFGFLNSLLWMAGAGIERMTALSPDGPREA